MNDCKFIGYVAQRPELKTTPGGTYVCSFDFAIPRRKKEPDGKRKYDYITIEAWDKRAEFCTRFLDKNTMIAVTTQLKTESWEKDGVKRKKFIFTLTDDVDFCGKPSQAAQSNAQAAQNATNAYEATNYTPTAQTSQNGANGAAYAPQPQYAPPLDELSDDEELPF